MNFAIAVALLLLLGLLTLVSYVDRLYTEIGKFLSREFQDNINAFEQRIEPKLHVTPARASLSMAILTQLVIAAMGLLLVLPLFRERMWIVNEILQAGCSLVVSVFVSTRFCRLVFFSETIVECS